MKSMISLSVCLCMGVSFFMTGSQDCLNDPLLNGVGPGGYNTVAVSNKELVVRRGAICSIAVHPAAQITYIGKAGKDELFYEIEDSQNTLNRRRADTKALALFSPDGKNFIAAGGDIIHFSFDRDGGEKKLDQRYVSALTFSGNSRYLEIATTGRDHDNKLAFYNMEDKNFLEWFKSKDQEEKVGEEDVRTHLSAASHRVELHERVTILTAASFQKPKDRQQISWERLAIVEDQNVLLYEFDPADITGTFNKSNALFRPQGVNDARFNLEGDRLALAFNDGLQLINPKTGSELFSLKINNDPLRCLSFATDKDLLMGTSDGKVLCLDTGKTRQVTFPVYIYKDLEMDTISAIGSNKDGSLIAYGGGDVCKRSSLSALKNAAVEKIVEDNTLELDSAQLAALIRRKKCRRRVCCIVGGLPIAALLSIGWWYGIDPLIQVHSA